MASNISKVGMELFSQASRDKMRGNGFELHQGRLRLGRNFFTVRVEKTNFLSVRVV